MIGIKKSQFLFHIALAMAISPSHFAFASNGPHPRVGGESGIRFITGGIGCDEARLIRSQSRNYSLQLMFIVKTGVDGLYLSSVPVSIFDDRGNSVMSTVTDGPFLLVDVPAGVYVIKAEYKDQIRVTRVQVRANDHRQVSFSWLDDAEQSHGSKHAQAHSGTTCT